MLGKGITLKDYAKKEMRRLQQNELPIQNLLGQKREYTTANDFASSR
jgi:hypothetical protein